MEKKSIFYILLCLFLFSILCYNFFGITDKQLQATGPTKIKFERMSCNEVAELLGEALKIKESASIILMDDIYTDYGSALLAAITISGQQIKGLYKNELFDCEDIAYYIKSHSAYLLSKEYALNSAPVGVAFCKIVPFEGEEKDLYHALNVFILDKKVYLFDAQFADFYEASEYIKIAEVLVILI